MFCYLVYYWYISDFSLGPEWPHSVCYSSWEFCTSLTNEMVQCLQIRAESEVTYVTPNTLHTDMVERLFVFKAYSADSLVALCSRVWAAEQPSLHKPSLLFASSHHCCQLPGDSSLLAPYFSSLMSPIDHPLETRNNLSNSPRQNRVWHPPVPLKCVTPTGADMSLGLRMFL